MNRIRSFVPLGVPASAVKLLGNPSEFAVARGAQVLAFSKSGSETVVSPGRFQHVSVVAQAQWKIHESVLLAQRSDKLVLAAPGGLYRVDVDEGSQFVCDPRKVMGSLGVLRTRIVYAESRLDVARAWLNASWSYTASVFRRSWRVLAHWLGRVPVPHRLSQYRPTSARPYLPPDVRRVWQASKTRLGEFTKFVSAKTFYWTHPPKLVIEGPCSLLVRP